MLFISFSKTIVLIRHAGSVLKCLIRIFIYFIPFYFKRYMGLLISARVRVVTLDAHTNIYIYALNIYDQLIHVVLLNMYYPPHTHTHTPTFVSLRDLTLITNAISDFAINFSRTACRYPLLLLILTIRKLLSSLCHFKRSLLRGYFPQKQRHRYASKCFTSEIHYFMNNLAALHLWYGVSTPRS